MIAKHEKQPSYKVGDHVVLRFGTRTISGRIVKDLGGIGVQGRQLVRVRAVDAADDESDEFEVPAEELQAASP